MLLDKLMKQYSTYGEIVKLFDNASFKEMKGEQVLLDMKKMLTNYKMG